MARTLFNLALVGTSAIAGATTVPFGRVFAPQQGPTVSVERPFRDELCLNGNWQLQPVANELPAAKADGWEKTPVRVPSPWNVNAFPTESREGGDFRCFPSYPKAWEGVQAGWLRRSFGVPAGWRGKRLILRFDAVAGDARVLVNGKEVARRFDLFLPFEVDVTDVVRLGAKNELLVGVRKASLTDVQGPFGRRTYQGGSMWGQAIAGIWQDVFLKAVPAVRVDEVFVKPDVAKGVLGAEVTLRNDSGAARTVRLGADVLPWVNQAGKGTLEAPEPKGVFGKRALAIAERSVTVPAHGTAKVSLTAPGGGLKFWAPGSPNLYGLLCRIEGDSKVTRFGWRQVTFQGTKLLLNGKPLVMRGDSWHFMGIPQMTRRYAWAWFKTLQEAGLNAVRLHAQPYPEFYLDMADEMGILVLDETAVWASDGGPKLDSEAYWADAHRHLRELIRRDRNHASVFGWSVSNEVMAVVRNVFHAPKSVEEAADRYTGRAVAICREEDPTRVWISADGEDDEHGLLPTTVIHYGDRGTMERAEKRGKPWGVGEAGPAYYGSPKQIAEMAKDPRAYLSFADRMDGVAKVSYASLRDQNELGGSYRSVFNLVWYGLKPLELGLRDTSRPPTLEDGISFGPFVEGRPGVQPERLGPYCTTLNPGYDPSLPLYRTWPLFDAFRGAAKVPPVEYRSTSLPLDVGVARVGTVSGVRMLAGPGGTLGRSLIDLGVKLEGEGAVFFVDGANPPGAEAKAMINDRLGSGGTLVVWGVRGETLTGLNALLPRPLTLTGRMASSLVAARDPLTAGLSPADLYFSELSPSTILPGGLDGPLLAGAKVLLRASDTDWRRWNGQGETVKTAMVLRSEREAKASGVAMAEVAVGKGRLIVVNLPAEASTVQGAALNRTLLGNLGIGLSAEAGGRNLLDAKGFVTGALVLGPFGAGSGAQRFEGSAIKLGAKVGDRAWGRASADSEGRLLFSGITYLSFWVYSPVSLDNLLLDPHLPKVGLEVGGAEAVRVWLGGKALNVDGLVTSPLLLQAGWNHVLVRVAGGREARVRVASSIPEYLRQVRVVAERP